MADADAPIVWAGRLESEPAEGLPRVVRVGVRAGATVYELDDGRVVVRWVGTEEANRG
jgi:hypothetical protein